MKIKKLILWILTLGLLTGASAFYYVYYFAAAHKDPLKSEEIVKISATELYNLFSANEDSANNIFLGKTIRVSGKIALVEENNRRYNITYESPDEIGSVICEMDTSENMKAKLLKPGDMKDIVGFCNGVNLDVNLFRCKLAE